MWLCFRGFEPGGPAVRLVLTGKNGTSRSYDLKSDGSSWSWVLTPTFDLPLGEYSLRVTQGASVLTRAAVLNRPSSPAVYATAATQSGAVAIRLQLSGYPPRTAVSVFLYGPEQPDGRYPFVRPLPVATTDGNGDSDVTLGVEPGDPRGALGVWVNPAPGNCEDKLCASFRA